LRRTRFPCAATDVADLPHRLAARSREDDTGDVGYEVLDSGGDDRLGPPVPVPDEVVPLEDAVPLGVEPVELVPAPVAQASAANAGAPAAAGTDPAAGGTDPAAEAPPSPPDDVPAPPLAPPLTPPLTSPPPPQPGGPLRPLTAVLRAAHDASPAGRVVVAVVGAVALVAGLAVGTTIAGRHADERAAAATTSELAVAAVVTNVDAVGGSFAVDFTVKVVNAGPREVSIVPSPDDAVATTTRAVVRELGGATHVPPGGSLSANVRMAIDCTGRGDVRVTPHIPVRTQDGVVHQVAVAGTDASADAYFGSPCAQPGLPTLDANLTGTIHHPMLTLHNESEQAQHVTLDTEHSPFVEQSAEVSVLQLTPSLPLDLPAHATVSLRLRLTPAECPTGLSQLRDGQLSPYVVLRTGPPGSHRLAQQPVGVDLSTVWGAALARDCS
jgi:hypothetical protein